MRQRKKYLYKKSHIDNQRCDHSDYEPQDSIRDSRRTDVDINLQRERKMGLIQKIIEKVRGSLTREGKRVTGVLLLLSSSDTGCSCSQQLFLTNKGCFQHFDARSMNPTEINS